MNDMNACVRFQGVTVRYVPALQHLYGVMYDSITELAFLFSDYRLKL